MDAAPIYFFTYNCQAHLAEGEQDMATTTKTPNQAEAQSASTYVQEQRLVLVGLICLSIYYWLFIEAIQIYNHFMDIEFHDGYMRGARHAEIYFNQIGKFPSDSWKEKGWRFVNENDDFAVWAVER